MLPVKLQKLCVRVEPIRSTRDVQEGAFELNLNQCIYKIVGVNYGMVLKANLKVVAMYMYSRHVLKKIVCIIMI